MASDVLGRMDVAALRAAIETDRAAGDLPFLVVGTAGSVGTGIIDPLHELAAVCADYNLWFHVDGAYGGFANALPDAPSDLRGMALADSIAVDPHKWLYAPLEVGCALLRDPKALPAAFSYHPTYYHFGEEATNFFDHGPHNSRGFRALKVWLALRQAGAAAYRAMIADDIALAGALAREVERHADLELTSQSLSITTFRYVPPALRAHVGEQTAEAQINAINRELVDQLQRQGEVFLSHAMLGDRLVLRACIVNFHTSSEDVAAVPHIVVRVGARIVAETRQPA